MASVDPLWPPHFKHPGYMPASHTNRIRVCLYREFYYIQMEKYARQAVSEGVQRSEDIHVNKDSEIYRVLNLHYNRNNHIEVSARAHCGVCYVGTIGVRTCLRYIIGLFPANGFSRENREGREGGFRLPCRVLERRLV